MSFLSRMPSLPWPEATHWMPAGTDWCASWTREICAAGRTAWSCRTGSWNTARDSPRPSTQSASAAGREYDVITLHGIIRSKNVIRPTTSLDWHVNRQNDDTKLHPAIHGSPEGHFMLKRHGICRSIADVELIQKMWFLSKSVDCLFQKTPFCATHDIFFAVWFRYVLNSKYILSSPTEYLQSREPYPSQKSTENIIHVPHS